jgi:hypothetical protein
LPLYNYRKVIEEGEKRYLLKLDDYNDLPNVNQSQIEALWEAIQDQIIDSFGISDKFKQLLRLENEILRLKLKAAIEGDKTLESVAEVKEMQLKKQLNIKTKTQGIEELIASIDIKFKINIDERQISVKKFYNYLKIMTRK